MITAYAASRHLNKDFGGVPYTEPAIWYIAFLNDGVELDTVNNYARIAVTNNTTNWPSISTNTMVNGIEFEISAEGDWDEANEVALYDDLTAGNMWYTDPLEESFTMRDGQTRSFAPGDLRIREV